MMKKAYFLVVLLLCGLSVENVFTSASAAATAAENGLKEQLINAVIKSDEDTVKWLLPAVTPDILNAPDMYGTTVLMYAAQWSSPAIVDLLVQAGANVNADALGFTALMYAAQRGNPAIVRLLLSRGAKKEMETKGKRTAAHLAQDPDLANYIRGYTPSSGGRTKSARKR